MHRESRRFKAGPAWTWAIAGAALLILSVAACDGGTSTASCQGKRVAGDLVISEIMADPLGTDEGKEWFEIYNATSATIDLRGLKLVAARADGSGELIHIMSASSIGAGKYYVLGGMLPTVKPTYVDYAYGADLGGLRNESGKLALSCGDTVIDAVVYAKMTQAHSLQFDGAMAPDGVANDTQSKWCDATVEITAGSGEYGSPQLSNEPCQSLPPTQCKEGGVARDIVAPQVGDLVFDEFLANPTSTDTDREWFEVAVTRDVDLNGLEVGKTPGTVDLKVSALDCIKATAGSVLLFAQSNDPLVNGGLPAPDQLFDFSLVNSNGSLFLGYASQVLDQITWTSSYDGASTGLDPTLLTPTDNDNPANWCEAVDTYGTAGNLGTPKAANPSCGIVPPGQCLEGGVARDKVPPQAGQLVITEFLANPTGTDTNKEWFEVLTTADVDLNGLELGKVVDTVAMTVPEGDCLHFAAGSYILFGQTTDPATKGGLPTVDEDINFTINNRGSLLFEGLGGVVLDQVDYTSVSDGASTSLSPDHLNPTDNDDPLNWCPGVDAYGTNGDFGTPRAANPACP
jgi:hypothetical protein